MCRGKIFNMIFQQFEHQCFCGKSRLHCKCTNTTDFLQAGEDVKKFAMLQLFRTSRRREVSQLRAGTKLSLIDLDPDLIMSHKPRRTLLKRTDPGLGCLTNLSWMGIPKKNIPF